MEAIQDLQREREVIRKVVRVMARIRTQLEEKQTVDAELLRDVVQFMRIFCDQCHHGKQDSYLFPLLESKGLSTVGGPMTDLQKEHEKGRMLTNELSRACSKYITNPETGRVGLMRALRSLVSFYHVHLLKEEYFFRPIAEKLLSIEDRDLLIDQFRSAESDIGVGAHDAYEVLAEDLEQRIARLEQDVHRAA